MKIITRLCSLLLVLVSLLLMSPGCNKETAPLSEVPSEVRIGYFANLTHAQAVLGVQSGEFAAAIAPSRLKPRVFNAGPSLIEALFAGEIDIGYVGPGPAIAGFTRSHGEALQVVSGAAANGVVIVAAKGSPIQSLADLAGKRLATPQRANTQDIAARHYLTAVLKQKDTDSVLPVANAEQAALMDHGQLDAAWVPEPWGAMLEKMCGARVIAEEKDLWSGGEFATTIVVASPKFIKDHPATLEKLLGVHRQWTQRLNSRDPAIITSLKNGLFALTSKELPAGVIDTALPRVRFTNDPLPASLQTMADWTYETGFAKEKPALSTMVNQHFTPTALPVK